jgi:hypothetical protein
MERATPDRPSESFLERLTDADWELVEGLESPFDPEDFEDSDDP